MKDRAIPIATFLLASIAVLSVPAAALSTDAPDTPAQMQEEPGGQSPAAPGNTAGQRRRGPPPEAIAACQGKAGGAACSFVNRRNETRSGTCFAPPVASTGSVETPVQHPLACRPARPAGVASPG